jgi:hypothetical protein
MSILTNDNILDISKQVSTKLKRPLSDNENLKIALRLKSESITEYKYYNRNAVIAALVNRMVNVLNNTDTTNDAQNIRDWQQREMTSAEYASGGLSDLAYVNRELTDGYYENKHFDRTTEFDKNDDEHVIKANFDVIDDEFTTLVGKKIELTTLFNSSDLYMLQRLIAPKAQYKHVYVLLDTGNAAPELSSGTKYGWNFANNALLQNGVVNTTGTAGNLVGMHIHPMITDLVSNPSHSFATATTGIILASITGVNPIYKNDFTNLNQSFTILIEEFSSQAFVGRNGRKFHFMLYPFLMNPTSDPDNPSLLSAWTPTNPYYEFVTSGKGDGWFWFNEPITEFSTLTVSMANPFIEFSLASQTRTLIPLELIYLADREGE